MYSITKSMFFVICLEIKLSLTRPIIDTKNEVKSIKLTISNVTEKSFGTYKCLVQADVGNYSESINLEAVSKDQGKEAWISGCRNNKWILKINAVNLHGRSDGRCHRFGDDRCGTFIDCNSYFFRLFAQGELHFF